MIPCSDDVHHMRDEWRLPLKQRQHESASKANRQLVKRNPPSSSRGTDLRISSPNTFTQNGSTGEVNLLILSNLDMHSSHSK
ncbi:unnamed protein product [Protopolystoma xenopodis]|uniref:Uncharacterized protein n=1 Tax=Protopolystoma xenopodis TaxID=117903 RepID=A0A3S5CB58_9PLAT|nr:unnamed protein product [Protopolystoma xenopodis]